MRPAYLSQKNGEVFLMDKLENKVWYYTRLQNLAIEDENLDIYESHIYTVICYYADKEENTCFPSFNTIADKAGCSRRKAIDAVNNLVEYGYIEKEKREDNRSNLYTIVDLRYIFVFRDLAEEEGRLDEFNERLNEHPVPSKKELKSVIYPSAQHAPGSAQHAPELNKKNNTYLNRMDEDEKRVRGKFMETFDSEMRPAHLERIKPYLDKFDLDVILEVFNIAQMNFASSFNYVIEVLDDWERKGDKNDEVQDLNHEESMEHLESLLKS